MENIVIDANNLEGILQTINEVIIPDEFDSIAEINSTKLQHLTGTLAAAQLLASKLANETQYFIEKHG